MAVTVDGESSKSHNASSRSAKRSRKSEHPRIGSVNETSSDDDSSDSDSDSGSSWAVEDTVPAAQKQWLEITNYHDEKYRTDLLREKQLDCWLHILSLIHISEPTRPY